MAGWQWLFLIEALPALVCGIAVFALMVDRPAQAEWLTENEKALVTSEIEREDAEKTTHHNLGAILSDRHIWKLCAVYFCQIIGLYGIRVLFSSLILESGLSRVLTI